MVYFMTPWAGVLMLGCGHISHYSEYVVSSTLSTYSTLVAIMMLLSYTIIYAKIGLLIYKCEPL